MTRVVAAFVALFAFGATAAASAAPRDPADAGKTPLEMAKEESSVKTPPVSAIDTPAGRLGVARAELLAARFGQKIRFELELDRDVAQGTLSLALPKRWRTPGPGGLRATRLPRKASDARGYAFTRDANVARIRLSGARAGDTAAVSVTDTGIPAGRHRIPVTWREAGGRARRAGTIEVHLYAPVRETDANANPWAELREVNVSNDTTTESETYMTVVPGNSQRVLASANSGSGLHSAFISTDGGTTWAQKDLPTLTDFKGTTTDQTLSHGGDPMSAADSAGNFWYGNLSQNVIVVSRIPAGGTNFVSKSVAVPTETAGFQDKNLMTIDNSPTSPTYGRLYVAWGGAGGPKMVYSFCDTRTNGGATLDAPRCDNADNWSNAIALTGPGSYIYADMAVGPDGRAYYVWHNYSSTNAIQGRTCAPATGCDSAADWAPVQTIATLDATGGQPLPFECPIVAQPGGRASTAPGVETDISGGANNGRVYVTWSDITGPGTTRCGDNVTPATTHRNFDSYVASAVGALPGSASPSPTAGTKLLVDGEGGGQAASDDWFPWLAVDQTTGIAYANFYSTRLDSTRKTTQFYVRSVLGSQLGQLTQVSTTPSDYSANPCCGFGNDYGDYTGIDATNGVVFPVWSQKTAGQDGEVYADATTIPPPGPAANLTFGPPAVTDAAPGGDADGVAEPGETVKVSQPVTNSGTATATGVLGTLTSNTAGVTVPDGSASYGDIAQSATASPDAPYQVTIGNSVACGASVSLTNGLTYAGGSKTSPITFATGTPPFTATGMPVSIPDGSGAATSTITVPGSATVSNLDVGVDISHTYVGDIVVKLKGPDNTEITLFDPADGDSGDNLTGTIFDDSASTSINSATAPFTGRFIPVQALSAFNGKALNGTWTLTVADSAAQDVGQILGWSLRQPSCSVGAVNQPPVAALTGPASAQQNVSFQLDASGSSDPDAGDSITKYEWDLDANGTFETNTGMTATASTSFATTGDKTVKVRVTDENAATAQASHVVNISSTPPVNNPPLASLTGPASAQQNVSFELDAAGSSDPDAGDSITKYEWDLDANGTFETNTGMTATASTSFATTGNKTLRVRVTDENAATAEDTHVVNITAPSSNQLPTATITGPATGLVDQLLDYSGATSTDGDGSITRYEWDLDGNPDFAANDSYVDGGSDPVLQDISANAPGTYTIHLRVTDDDGATDVDDHTITITAAPNNAAPNAVITGPAGGLVDELLDYTGAASSDSDGTVERYEWDLDGNGDFAGDSYIDGGANPLLEDISASSPGTYTIALRVTDDDGATDVVTKDIVITEPVAPQNQAPLAVIGGPATAAVNQAVTFSAAGSADPDGTIASYEWDLDGNGTFESFTGPNNSVGHAYGTAGTYTVRVKVTDDRGASATAARVITVGSGTQILPPQAALLGKDGRSVKAGSGRFAVQVAGCAGCTATLVATTAKKVAVKKGGKKKKVRLAKVSGPMSTVGTAKLTAKLSKAHRKMLKRLKKVPVKLTLTVINSVGQKKVATGRLTLKR